MKKISAVLTAILIAGLLTACESRSGCSADQAPEQQQPFVNSIKDDAREVRRDWEDESEEQEDQEDSGPDQQAVEDTVRELFSAMQSGSREQIQSRIDYTNLLLLSSGQDDVNFLSMLKKMQYEIVEVEVQPTQATATVRITNVDMTSGVLTGYLQQAMELQYNNAIAENPRSENEMETAYTDLFMEVLGQNSSNTVTQTVDIRLYLEAGRWIPQTSDELRQALFGNFFTAQQQTGFAAG